MSDYDPAEDGRRCSVECCTKRPRGRGLCSAHHTRMLRHGSPLGGGTNRGDPPKFLHEVVIPYSGDDCPTWPYSRTIHGYGQITYKGKLYRVHRLVCETVHGAPPSPTHQAAHGCGRGKQGCVNPRHLSWKTPAENSADKFIHGVQPLGSECLSAKLSADDVAIIRSLAGKQTQRQLARRFGVARTTISTIQTGRTWSWLGDGAAQ